MLIEIKQTDKELLEPIQKYGCLFLCFAYSSPFNFEGELGRFALNHLWHKAIENSIISKNFIVLNHNKLAELFKLNARYDDMHHSAEEKIPSKVKFVFGEYVYEDSHFVILSKDKKVIFDPYGKSNTVAKGKLHSMRWYYDN